MTKLEADGGFVAAVQHVSNLTPTELHEEHNQEGWNAEKSLAEEFHKLSVQEREQVYHDLHGVSDIPEETPELLDSRIKQLQNLLEEMSGQEQQDPRIASYLLALRQNPVFVQGRWLAKVFLRAASFDVSLAAQKLLAHFHVQHQLMGAEKVAKVIQQEDLCVEEKEFLNRGGVQLLPTRDSTGRAVMFFCPQQVKNMDWTAARHALNATAYLTWKAIQDEETQKKGVIWIIYNVGPFRMNYIDPFMPIHAAKISPALPFRIAGYHVCYSSPLYRPISSLARQSWVKQVRVRWRFHEGSHMYCRYQLMTFGLPIQHFPVNEDGVLSNRRHTAWLLAHRMREELVSPSGSNDEDQVVVVPHIADVLPGRAYSSYPGNMRFKLLVEKHFESYHNGNHAAKTMVVQAIAKEVAEKSGRFLRDSSGIWLVEDDEAVVKARIGSAMRSLKRVHKNNSSKQEAALAKCKQEPP